MTSKLLLFNAAAALTNGVMSNAPDNLTVSATLTEDTKTANGMAAAVFTTFYDFLSRALADETVFKSPAAAGSLDDALAKLLEKLGSQLGSQVAKV